LSSHESKVWYTWGMNETHPTYTIKHTRVGDHLEVTIVELGLTVETQPGQTSYDDALDLAHDVIVEHQLKQREHEQVAS
jgi:hypothetical protein